MKFINKMQKFMMYRNGIDELNLFILKIYFLLMILNIFLKSNIIVDIEFIIILIGLYRCLSKNIIVRQKENKKFIKYKKQLTKPISNIKRYYKDKDEWIYKRCKHCNKLLKLSIPDKRGIKTIKCPKCKKNSKIFTLRQIKVEFVKKRGK